MNEERRTIQKIGISKYIEVNKIMNKKKDLTNKEINKFNNLVDDQFDKTMVNFFNN